MFIEREKLIRLAVLAMLFSSVPATVAFAEETAASMSQTTGAAVMIDVGDTTEPVLNSISIDKRSVTNGEKLTITIDASDDISGIKSISISYDAPSGSAGKYIPLSKNSEGEYVGSITIGANDATGIWKINLIRLEDNASNYINVFNSEKFTSAALENSILEDLSAGDFEVTGTIPDITEPSLNSISVDKNTAANGENITVAIDASDDISGIKSISISYDAPSGSAGKYVSLSKNSEGEYVGSITIGPNDASGIWKVTLIRLEDNASNYVDVFNSEKFTSATLENSILKDLSAGDFEVAGTIPDVTEPSLSSINVDKRTAVNGGKITVTANASDDISGIKNISISYDAPSGSAGKYVSLSKNNEGEYVGSITIGPNDAAGIWKVALIRLEDNASNYVDVFNSEKFTSASLENSILKDLRSGAFEVIRTNADIPVTPPAPTDEPSEDVEMPTSVRIRGTEKVGNTLRAELIRNGIEFIAGTSVNIRYEWIRLENENSETGELIGKNQTYELVSNDLGKYIKLVVYYNNKKVDEDVTLDIRKKASGGGSGSSSSGSSSSSSGSNSSSSSSGSASSSSSNTTASNADLAIIHTAKVEKSEDGIIRLRNEIGQAVTGWQQIDGKWYLANLTGVAQTGWQQVNGTWYLLNNNGAMETGWKQVNGVWYLLKDNGAMATGWQQTNGKWYYLYSDGSMASNTVIDGYRVDASGAWV